MTTAYTPLFVTSADVVSQLNPEGNPAKFGIGSIDDNAWDNILKGTDGNVLAFCEELKRRLVRKCSGLVLTREAAGGELTFDIPAVLHVVTAVKVWVNPCVAYNRLKVADCVPATVDAYIDVDGTQTITLETALEEGDVAIADVTHNFRNPPALLRDLALELAVCKVVEACRSLKMDQSLMQQYDQKMAHFMEISSRVSKGRNQIVEWSDLDIVDENEVAWSEGPGQEAFWL